MKVREFAKRILPQGRALPDETWRGRHWGVLFLLWAHAAAVPAYALARGFPLRHALLEGMILPVTAVAATTRTLPRRLRTLVASLGLLSSSAVLVHLSGGLIEMHFHFFVMVAVVALYQDWLPFLASIGYVVLHHGVFGALDPKSVFNHPAAISNPWKWAFVHALFVAGISVACLVTWRMNEHMMDQRRTAEDNLRAEKGIAEAATRRMSLIAGAGQVLWSSLEPDEIPRKLATLLVPAIADAVTVDLVDEEGGLRRAAAIGTDVEGHLSPKGFGGGGCSETTAIPMKRRGRTLGTITIGVKKNDDRSLSPEDVHVAEEIVRRAGVALENARLYQAQRDLAATLQHSLLPEELPEIPGVATAMQYIPGGPGVDVGGDWYDVMELPDGTFGLAMGDVVGRGIPAASLMGQLRNALRAYAMSDASPASIMQRINVLLTETGSPEQMATLVYAVFDPETGVLTFANAGHPPPLVLGSDGSADWIAGASGPPLGAMKRCQFKETTVSMKPGATLLLYTDGLVEDRDTPIQQGLEALRNAAVSAGECDVGALCERILENSRPRQLGRDDTALLALRYLPMSERLSLRLPATPGSLKQLRSAVRRWLRHAGASHAESYEILAAIGEACANAIQHSSAAVGAMFEVEAELNAGIHLRVRSRGSWRAPRPDGDGRGIEIMRRFMDDVQIAETDGAIEVAMFKSIEGGHKVRVPS